MRLQKIKVFDEQEQPAGYKEQEDPHYFTKGLSKAQRNALQYVIPADFVARMIDKFLALSGKQPLKQLPKPKEIKPRVSKDLPELSPEDITDFNSLERYAFNRYHLQPKQMYQQLGYDNRLGCQEPPWECFLKLKEIFES